MVLVTNRIFIIAFLLFLGSIHPSYAMEPIVLEKGWKEFTPGLHMEYLEDKTTELTAEDLLRPEVARGFIESKDKYLGFGFTKSAYWAKFTIENPQDIPQEWFLEIWWAFRKMDLYIVVDDQIVSHKQAGRIYPFSQRDVNFHNIILKETVPANSTYTVLIRNKTPIVNFPYDIYGTDSIHERIQNDLIITSALMGIMLIMAIYNLCIYFFLRDSRYLFYFLVICGGIVINMTRNGIAFQLFWPNSPEIELMAVPISIAIGGIMLSTLFIMSFAQTKEHTPRLHLLLKVFLGISFAIVFFSFIDFVLAIKILLLSVLPFSIVAISIAIIRLRQGYTPARYFLLGWLALFSIATLRALGAMDFLSTSPYLTLYGMLVAFTLDAVFLSLALADSINSLRTEKLLVQKEMLEGQQDHARDLKQKVEERTHELALAKDALTNALRETQTIMDTNPDILYVFNMDAKLVKWNKGLENLTGLSKKELLMRPVGEFVCEEDREMVNQIIKEVFEKGKSDIETRLIDKNGKLIAYLCNGIVLKNDLKQVIGFTGSGRDIREMKKVENELRVAKELAESANQSKSDFLSIMSHEIRTPLNPIIGLTHLILKTKLNERQRDYIEKIQAASKSLLGVINDILDFSKIEADKLDVEQVEFRMSNVLKDLSSLHSIRSREKGLKFTTSLQKEIPDLLIGDPLRLEQVLSNLVSNAIKFTEKGSVHVGIEALRMTQTAVSIQFFVKDTGVGIPKGQQAKLFQAFTQEDSSITRKYGGTGLGLSICSRLVNLMGGDISLKSELKKGSTFSFLLDFTYVDAALAEERNPPISVGEKSPTDETDLNTRDFPLLVVDDNKVNQMVAQELLGDYGFPVTVADNGNHALDILKKQSFALIFMDIQMPEMDGYETTKKIRKNVDHAEVPIIAMTAHAMDGVRSKCIEAGMNDHISKPIDPKLCIETLFRWLKGTTNKDVPLKSKRSPSMGKLPEALPGINLKKLHQNLRGNDTFCLKLLNKFHELNKDVMTQIHENHAAGKTLEASRIAHKLIGGAGTICAMEVSSAAKELETALEENREGINDLFEKLETAFRTVMFSIVSLKEASTRGNETKIKSGNDSYNISEDVLPHLYKKLKTNDFEAKALYYGLVSKTNDEALKRCLQNMRDDIESLQFSAAAKVLQEYMQTKGKAYQSSSNITGKH